MIDLGAGIPAVRTDRAPAVPAPASRRDPGAGRNAGRVHRSAASKGDPRSCGTLAFFLRVATNVCLNRLRWSRRHPEDRDDELLHRIAAEAPDGEGRSSARRLLDRIFRRESESTLAIAVMHYVDRMTLEEVAQESGLSVSGIRKRLRTLRARLPVASEPASQPGVEA